MSRSRGVTIRTDAEITSPHKGVACYRTASGTKVMFIHYSSDPDKQWSWARSISSDYPGGMNSAKWLREYEGDPDAADGERTFWAFHRPRNVIEAFPLPADWPISIGFDFGQTHATAAIFVAQDPLTRRSYVFDSIYRPKGISDDFKRQVYDVISHHRGLGVPELLIAGLDRFCERIVGDPSGAAYVTFYARDPYPIYISTNTHKAAMQRLQASEAHVNAGLHPSFFCCGALQYPASDVEEGAIPQCARCKKEAKPRPLVYLFAGAAPELESQLESLVRVKALNPLLETPEKTVKAPDHAADAFRYVLRVMTWEPPTDMAAEELRMRMDNLLRRRKGQGTPEELIEIEELEVDMAAAEMKNEGQIRVTRMPVGRVAGGIYVN